MLGDDCDRINAWIGRPISLVPISIKWAFGWDAANSLNTAMASDHVGVLLSAARICGSELEAVDCAITRWKGTVTASEKKAKKRRLRGMWFFNFRTKIRTLLR